MPVVLDECTSEFLAIKVGRHFESKAVARVLDKLTAIRGAPVRLRSGNGSELASSSVRNWC